MDPEKAAAIRALAQDPANKAAKAAMREDVLATIHEIMTDGQNEGARVTAALGLAKKVGLQDEPTETRVTGSEGGPLVVRWMTEAETARPAGD